MINYMSASDSIFGRLCVCAHVSALDEEMFLEKSYYIPSPWLNVISCKKIPMILIRTTGKESSRSFPSYWNVLCNECVGWNVDRRRIWRWAVVFVPGVLAKIREKNSDDICQVSRCTFLWYYDLAFLLLCTGRSFRFSLLWHCLLRLSIFFWISKPALGRGQSDETWVLNRCVAA